MVGAVSITFATLSASPAPRNAGDVTGEGANARARFVGRAPLAAELSEGDHRTVLHPNLRPQRLGLRGGPGLPANRMPDRETDVRVFSRGVVGQRMATCAHWVRDGPTFSVQRTTP